MQPCILCFNFDGDHIVHVYDYGASAVCNDSDSFSAVLLEFGLSEGGVQDLLRQVRLFVKAHCDAGALPFPKASVLKSAPPKVLSPQAVAASTPRVRR